MLIMGVYMMADPLGCYGSVLLNSLGVDRRRGTVNDHLSTFALTFNFPGECGVHPCPCRSLSCNGFEPDLPSTEFPLDSTSGSWTYGTVTEERLI